MIENINKTTLYICIILNYYKTKQKQLQLILIPKNAYCQNLKSSVLIAYTMYFMNYELWLMIHDSCLMILIMGLIIYDSQMGYNWWLIMNSDGCLI